MAFDLLTDAWVAWGQSCLLSHRNESSTWVSIRGWVLPHVPRVSECQRGARILSPTLKWTVLEEDPSK